MLCGARCGRVRLEACTSTSTPRRRLRRPPRAGRRGAACAAALALQRKIGNRAFGQLVARTPEDSVELLEGAILGAHVNVEQINRTFLPYSKDQDSFDKMAEAYETKTEMPLQKAIETHVPAGELEDVRQRVPWRGFPPPKAEGAAARAAAPPELRR